MTCPAPETPTYNDSPAAVCLAAADRLLYLQARHAAGFPPPAVDYAGGDGDLSPQEQLLYLEAARAERGPTAVGVLDGFGAHQHSYACVHPLPAPAWAGDWTQESLRVRRVQGSGKGDGGTKDQPTIPREVVELLTFLDLLRVFETARDESADELPASIPATAGGVWWAVRWEGRDIAALAAETGAKVADLRAAMHAYEYYLARGLAGVSLG